MDRDPNKTYGTTGGAAGGSSGSGQNPGFQNSGAGYGGGMNTGGTDAGYGATSGTSAREFTDTGSESSGGMREGARERLGHAREAASEKLGQARTKAHDLKHRFADTLDAGADRLRSRGTTGDAAYAGADGMSAISANDSTQSRVGEKVAGGMHSTAEWLRQNDMDSMKRNVEEQVRTNPARSLLVAAVAGYLIGKVLRR